jgi:hypothetical protein
VNTALPSSYSPALSRKRCSLAARGPVLGFLLALSLIPLFTVLDIPFAEALPLSVLFGLAGYCFLPLAVVPDADAFTPKVLVAVYFVVYFGLRALYLTTDLRAHRMGFLYYDDYLARALWCANLGFAAFLFGYDFWRPKRARANRSVARLQWPTTFPALGITIILCIGFASSVYLYSLGAVVGNFNRLPRDTPVPGTPVLLATLINVGWVAVCAGLFVHKDKRSIWPVLLLCLAFLTVKVVYEGEKQSFLEPVVQAGIVYHYLRRRVSVTKLIVVGVPCIALAFGLINTYRFIIVGKVGGVPKSLSDVRDRVALAIDYYSSGEKDPTQKSTFAQFMERENGVDALALTIKYTPERRPFGLGRTYLLFPLQAFVPRQIWPEKPVYHPTDDFERDYLCFPPGVVGFTSMHLISDFYQNFSYFGVIGGFVLMGRLLRSFFSLCVPSPANAAGVFIYAFLLPNMIHLMEGDLVGLAMQLVRWLLLLGCVCALIGVRYRRTCASRPENFSPIFELRPA